MGEGLNCRGVVGIMGRGTSTKRLLFILMTISPFLFSSSSFTPICNFLLFLICGWLIVRWLFNIFAYRVPVDMQKRVKKHCPWLRGFDGEIFQIALLLLFVFPVIINLRTKCGNSCSIVWVRFSPCFFPSTSTLVHFVLPPALLFCASLVCLRGWQIDLLGNKETWEKLAFVGRRGRICTLCNQFFCCSPLFWRWIDPSSRGTRSYLDWFSSKIVGSTATKAAIAWCLMLEGERCS